MKTPIEVKEFIVSKFKSVSRFALLVNLDPTGLHNLFKNQNPSAKSEHVFNLAEATENKPSKEEITQAERDELEKFIKENYHGNKSAFSRATKSDLMKVQNILNGHSTRKSKLVKHVFKAAGIGAKKKSPAKAPKNS